MSVENWELVSDENLPPLDEIVWLWDGEGIWIGGRANDGDGWLWGNTRRDAWWDGKEWSGQLLTDDEYKPTHWKSLPKPPIIPQVVS